MRLRGSSAMTRYNVTAYRRLQTWSKSAGFQDRNNNADHALGSITITCDSADDALVRSWGILQRKTHGRVDYTTCEASDVR